MWQSREEARRELVVLLGTEAFVFLDGITCLEDVQIELSPDMTLGVAVMPSSCVEAVKRRVARLAVLKIPRYFKTVAQWYASDV